MRKKNEGADIYIPQIARRDEIRELYDGIRELLMEIRHEQIQKKEYQLRLLQYQINPHFLYNSLDTIQWKAFEHRERDLTDMIRNLSYFLRSGLNQADIVTIRDELMHLNSYIALQNIRYEGQFSISVSVDDGLMDQQITKISLQPLVENSIMHAMNRHSGGSLIKISGKRTSADTFVLSVFDDGQALDLERVNRILEKRNPDPTSFGIRNVHERIQLYFGDSYGLSVRKLDSGTSFDIKLPYYGPGTQIP
jgi:sensor histidine kinase YesM